MESRMAQFTELVATAIANADSRAEVVASRARVLAAGDATCRRRVSTSTTAPSSACSSTILTLYWPRARCASTTPRRSHSSRRALDQAEQANAELRELAQGILPSVLTQGGLLAGVHALASAHRPLGEGRRLQPASPLAIEASATSSSPRR